MAQSLQKDIAINNLDSVFVTAFRSKTISQNIPVSVAHLSSKVLTQEINATLLPAINSIAGVKMEQRSPASYRLSIRGSSLRSPFGIRNVKIYWNQIPFTDPTGNTYLNILPTSLIGSIDIMKGPVGASYGLGTGGAVLLQSNFALDSFTRSSVLANSRGGSFGLFGQDLRITFKNKKVQQTFFVSNESSKGWREQSATNKKNITWLTSVTTNKQLLYTTLLFTDLMYQTPGGLTLAQMQQNPTWARQATSVLPGAVTQQTAVFNKTLLGSVRHQYQFSKKLTWENFILTAQTNFKNPFITNYETRNEKNISTGSHITYDAHPAFGTIKIVMGGEWQMQHALIHNYGNKKGIIDTLQFADDITTKQGFLFLNASLRVNNQWFFELGISDASMRYNYIRTSNNTLPPASKANTGLLAPQLGVSYALTPHTNIYVQISKGFSPPTLAEIRPSDGLFYTTLAPEFGWNIEGGIKGVAAHGKLAYTLSVYHFNVQDAIVRQNTNSGVEYFVNAGSVKQNGVEMELTYKVIANNLHQLNCKMGYAYQPYRFVHYVQAGISYDGKEVTGNAKNQTVVSIDYSYQKKLSAFATLQTLSAVPLTDANDVYAPAYSLVQMGVSYHHKAIRYFIAIDNLLNTAYSLGNDINAAGKRYYNPAAPQSLLVGITAQLIKKSR
ncbi:MAG: TonB-dependent receptor [Sediminibacterium sp.]